MLKNLVWAAMFIQAIGARTGSIQAAGLVIHITGPGSTAKYILEGSNQPEPVHVRVGQTVLWKNDAQTTTTHTASSKKRDAAGNRLFDTGNIGVGAQKEIPITQAIFTAAGGTAGGSVELEYICKLHGEQNMHASLIVEDTATPPDSAAALRVRKEVSTLTSAEVASLRRGVEVMRSRPASDRKSWRYWANMHGTTDLATDPLFNQCEHGTEFFFPWHRGYLFFFEQVLREASGDPNLTLPYWNWTTNRTVPAIYRNPVGTSANSLFEPLRQMNNNAMLSSTIVVTRLNLALQENSFFFLSSSPFGQQPDGFSGKLDLSPHGSVHTAVGGSNGVMSSIDTSANDPVFWAHHANVDRLLNRWLSVPGHHLPADSGFLNRSYTFVGVNGANATITVAAALNQTALGYRYDDDPAGGPVDSSPPRPLILASSVPEGEAAPAQPQPLGLNPLAIRLSLRGGEAANAMRMATEAAAPKSPERVMIDVVGLKFKQEPGYDYGVYLNLSDNEANPERLDLHFVDTISFFGRGFAHPAPGAAHARDAAAMRTFSTSLDATSTIARLKAAGLAVGDNLVVTLRPITIVPPPGEEASQQAQNQAAAQKARVTFDRVDVRLAPRH
jgi:plastocyanin